MPPNLCCVVAGTVVVLRLFSGPVDRLAQFRARKIAANPATAIRGNRFVRRHALCRRLGGTRGGPVRRVKYGGRGRKMRKKYHGASNAILK